MIYTWESKNTNMTLSSAVFKHGDEVGSLFIEVCASFCRRKKIVFNRVSCYTVTTCPDRSVTTCSHLSFSIRKNTDRKPVHIMI